MSEEGTDQSASRSPERSEVTAAVESAAFTSLISSSGDGSPQ